MIYFDNAATSYPKPKCVIKAVNQAITDFGGNPGRSGHKMSFKVAEKIYDIRKEIGNFFGAQAQNVIFCSNCTHALNMALKGLLKNGGHVVTSALEHNSVIRPLNELSNTKNVSFDIVKVYENNDEQTLLAFESKINERTKAVVATFASNVTGTILPIKQLGEICRKRGVTFIVDAAQSAGLLPINIKQFGINILCTAGHKSLYGITGTGLMILDSDIRLATIMEGGTGSVSVDPVQPEFYPDRFESGTLNTVGILSLGAGIDFIKKKGIENIYLHEMNLCKQLFDEIKDNDKFKLYTKNIKASRKTPTLSFNIKGVSSTDAVTMLSDLGFALRGGFHCSPVAHKEIDTINSGTVRFSPSYFNKPSEVKSLISAISKIARNGIN